MPTMPKMVHCGEFLKTWSLRSNSVTRQVSFNRTKIDGKCQNSKIEMRHFGWFSNTVPKDRVSETFQNDKKKSKHFPISVLRTSTENANCSLPSQTFHACFWNKFNLWNPTLSSCSTTKRFSNYKTFKHNKKCVEKSVSLWKFYRQLHCKRGWVH